MNLRPYCEDCDANRETGDDHLCDSCREEKQSKIPTFEKLVASPAADPVIPFGKHRGKYASQIDASYLDWMLGLDDLREPLRGQLLDHLKTRSDWKNLV